MKLMRLLVKFIFCFFSFCISATALEKIRVEGEQMFPTFKPETQSYNVFTNSEYANINVELSEGEELLSNLTNKVKLKDGINEVVIKVKKNENIIEYKLNIYKNYIINDNDSDALLKDLKVEGYDIDFNSKNYNYIINVDSVDEYINIDYITNNPNAYVKVVENLDSDNSYISILVTSKDKTSSQEYTLKLNKVSTTSTSIENNKEKIETNKKSSKVILIIVSILSIVLVYLSYNLLFVRKISFNLLRNYKREKGNK